MSVSILVVDDEPDVADLFRQRFRREVRQGDYVMHFAASGEQALDRLAGEIQPTLVAVLSDINMPGMDGLTLLSEIKQRFPDLPVMMITAYGDDERRRRAAEHGAAEFITKPVDFDQLKAVAPVARSSRLSHDRCLPVRIAEVEFHLKERLHSMSDQFEGGCLCGAVRFAATGQPESVAWCHCESCRKHSGAPVSVFVAFKRTAYVVTKGEITKFNSSPGRLRGFCAKCGSTLTCEGERSPETHFHVGAFNQAARFQPTRHIFPEERLPWLHLADA